MSKHHLILLRGLPGSGKTTLAALLSEQGTYPVFSVDDYFTDPVTGAYHFEFKENHLAYKHCEEQTKAAMQQGASKIILHNTFTIGWELETYFKLAAQFDYTVFVCTVENYHGHQNQHDIPDEQIAKMAEKYKVKLF
jgi:predicted kinase